MKRLAHALPLLLAACTNGALERVPDAPPIPRDDRMAVSGSFCTEEPKAVEFPLRVLFVVDVSQSMNVTDPAPQGCMGADCFTRRAQAVLEVLTAYPAGNGLEYALLTFSSGSSVLTQDASAQDGFSRDSELLKTKLPVLATANGETNYEGALADTFELLQADMIKLDATARGRARYVVIFLSDGLPAPVTPRSNTPERIRDRIQAIKSLERDQRLAEVVLHSVYMAGPDTPTATELAAKELLASMARVAGGTFRSFDVSEKPSFFYIDFRSFMRVFELKNLIATNLNSRLSEGLAAVDSDGDGLLDGEEREPGTDALAVDTDQDGWSDLLEVRLRSAGFDPVFPGDADCPLPSDRADDDGDGLRNCEERFLGTSSRLADSDADGIPDRVEFLGGGNPVAADDLGDTDLDGARNGVELGAHTDPGRNDTDDFSRTAYRYSVRLAAPTSTSSGRTCYEFTVENIALAPAMEGPGLPPGTNTILFYAITAPKDATFDFGNHHVACVRPQFSLSPERKLPPSGKMTLPLGAFKRMSPSPSTQEVFDASRDCLVP
ncbi:MAG: VWA domain-containing protein [Deltaproteobacteria bacterium]|nr:VWA domain-containing protein [Deltaproteobacteria bacterium]